MQNWIQERRKEGSSNRRTNSPLSCRLFFLSSFDRFVCLLFYFSHPIYAPSDNNMNLLWALLTLHALAEGGFGCAALYMDVFAGISVVDPIVRRCFGLATLCQAVIVIFLRLYLTAPSPSSPLENKNYHSALFAASCGFLFYHLGVASVFLWTYISVYNGKIGAVYPEIFYAHTAFSILFIIALALPSQSRDSVKKTR